MRFPGIGSHSDDDIDHRLARNRLCYLLKVPMPQFEPASTKPSAMAKTRPAASAHSSSIQVDDLAIRCVRWRDWSRQVSDIEGSAGKP